MTGCSFGVMIRGFIDQVFDVTGVVLCDWSGVLLIRLFDVTGVGFVWLIRGFIDKVFDVTGV